MLVFMDDKQKLISAIEGRMRTNERNLTNAYAALGKYAADEAQNAFPEGNVRILLNQIEEFRSAIKTATRMGKRILEIEDRLEAIREMLRRLENETGKLDKKNLPVYEEFGKFCAESYEESNLPSEARDLFAVIQELRQEEANTNEKISNLKESAREKTFLSRVLENGKAAVLGSSKNFRLRNLTKLYQNFGKAVLQSLETIPPDAYLNVYRTNRNKMRDNAVETENLLKEEAALEEDLGDLGVEKRFQKRLKDLEIQNDKNFSRLEELFAGTGREIFEKYTDFHDGKAEDFVEEIQSCVRKTAEYAEEKKKMEAAIAYDNLTRKIHDLGEDLESEEKAVITHKNRVAEIKVMIAETEKERTRFK
jgi:hypothetical protein